MTAFPLSHASFEAGGISDHSKCWIQVTTTNVNHRKPFKLFNFMVSHSDFLPRVAALRKETPPLYHSRAALTMFHRKLKKLKYTLRELNRTRFGNLPQQTAAAHSCLCSAQDRVLNDPNQINMAAVSEASENWHRLMNIEEKFF